jgi:hypothetical protein
MNTAPCWISRGEAWTGAEDFGAQLDRLTPAHHAMLNALVAAHHALSPCADAGACWCPAEVLLELCDLDAGHEGPHLFEGADRIMLEFPKETT